LIEKEKELAPKKEQPEGTEGDADPDAKGDSVDKMVYDLMKNSTMTSKTPDAPKKQTLVYKAKDPQGTTHYSDEANILKMVKAEKK